MTRGFFFAVVRVKKGIVLLALAGCGSAATMQSQECRDYIACYEKVGGTGSLDKTYAAGGSCWGGVGAMATSCTATCKSTLATLKASYPNAGC